MSLAEVMLLFLFTLMAAVTLEREPVPGGSGDPPEKRIKDLAERVAALEKDLEDTERQRAEERDRAKNLDDRLHYVLKAIGAPPLATDGEVEAAIARIGVVAVRKSRGEKPFCVEPKAENLLLEVRQVRGSRTVELLRLDAELQKDLEKAGPNLAVGQTLSAPGEIQRLLDAIHTTSGRRDCRYDYRLIFETPEDNFYAEELFEKYLYKGGGQLQLKASPE